METDFSVKSRISYTKEIDQAEGGKMECRLASLSDIDGVLLLQSKYHINTINEDDKKDGFVTTLFTRENLEDLVTKENGLHIALIDSKVVAYVMAASWHYWSSWPFFQHMIDHLHELTYLGQVLTLENSYQYGPICVDKDQRGSGVLEAIYEFSRQEMAKRYPILVTFINQNNPRSYEAHVRKLGLEVIKEFHLNNNDYYELVYDTRQKCKGK